MNPSMAERESCPDCMVLERENTELKERVKALESELETTRDGRHREKLDASEKA